MLLWAARKHVPLAAEPRPEQEQLPGWVKVVRGGLNEPKFRPSSAARPFHEITLGRREGPLPLVHNSLLVLPVGLAPSECRVLAQAADRRAAALIAAGSDCDGDPQALRLPVCELDAPARRLSADLLERRVVPFLESSLPLVSRAIFGKASGLVELSFEFSEHEPAVNVYSPGGDFRPHSDGYSLTVLVNLDEEGAFAGGGTAFWPEGPGSEREYQGVCEVMLLPPQGQCLLFNGNIRHAGRAVTSGVRHLYVASFDLLDISQPACSACGGQPAPAFGSATAPTLIA